MKIRSLYIIGLCFGICSLTAKAMDNWSFKKDDDGSTTFTMNIYSSLGEGRSVLHDEVESYITEVLKTNMYCWVREAYYTTCDPRRVVQYICHPDAHNPSIQRGRELGAFINLLGPGRL